MWHCIIKLLKEFRLKKPRNNYSSQLTIHDPTFVCRYDRWKKCKASLGKVAIVIVVAVAVVISVVAIVLNTSHSANGNTWMHSELCLTCLDTFYLHGLLVILSTINVCLPVQWSPPITAEKWTPLPLPGLAEVRKFEKRGGGMKPCWWTRCNLVLVLYLA
jgi:hypothetical protein